MKLRGILQGRLYVWWLTYRREARLAVLCLIFGFVLFAIHETRLMAVVAERDALNKSLKDMQAAKALPNTVFILEGSTIAKAQEKLARIAGDLDVARHEMGKR